MPTEELGLVRDILARNEASGQQLFINAAVTLSQAETQGRRGRRGGSSSQPLSQLWPCVHSGLTYRNSWAPSFYLSMSKSLLQVKTPPPPQALKDSPEEGNFLPF